MPRERRSGFTLLEVMVTIGVVGLAIVPILLVRESATVTLFEARNSNVARALARQLLSELEFHELSQPKVGSFDGYPGFTYTLDVREVDLVTGEGEEDTDKNSDGFKKDDAARNKSKNKNKKSKGSDGGSAFTPGDSIDPNDDDELDYPVRRVKLTLQYPNLSPSANGKDHELVIETILPPLPKDENVTALTKTSHDSASSKSGKK